jgi:hypothetical protein
VKDQSNILVATRVAVFDVQKPQIFYRTSIERSLVSLVDEQHHVIMPLEQVRKHTHNHCSVRLSVTVRNNENFIRNIVLNCVSSAADVGTAVHLNTVDKLLSRSRRILLKNYRGNEARFDFV